MQTDGDTEQRQVEVSTQTRKEHNLNQQQDFDLGYKLNKADSELNYAKAMARVVIGQETNMALDYGIKAKTLKLRVRCELDGIPEALITT